MSAQRISTNIVSIKYPFNIILVHHFLLFSLVISAHSAAAASFNAPPVFSTLRELKINEDQPIGSSFFTPQVIDDDPITYSIGPSQYKDGSKYFRVDSSTGEVFVNRSLSGLGGQDIFFYLIAHDGEHRARLEVHVQVFKTGEHLSNGPSSKLFPSRRGGHLIPGLPSTFHNGPRSHVSRPNATSFNFMPPPPPSTTTRRPLKSPPIDPLNNPKRNQNSTINIASSINSDESKTIITESTDSDRIQWLQSTQALYIIPIVCLASLSLIVCSIYKCQHSVPTRNAIKTFSHKIINNNKSDGSDTTVSSFSSETDYNGALFRTKKSFTNEMSINMDKSLLKVSESEWEFPRHHLKFVHILGEGCFGQVWKCEAVNIGNNGGSQVVAVKTLKQNANQKEKHDLLEELEVMKMLEPHPNVVTLIGCCAEQDPVLLIMEFIPNGTLQNYLRESRVDLNYGNQLQGNSRLTSHDLITFAYQVAKGMEYLSSKGVIHRDLAARNILVGYNKVCKIADFGFAKYDHIYERKSEGRLPIRWMAVESLTDFIFTTKSDVWSFGILMWEIVTLGWTPYPGFAAAEVIKKVCDGFRLEKPEHCKREMFNIMYYCWDRDANKRPSFTELVTMLDNILYSENDYIELDRFPDHAYYNILKPGMTGEKL